MRQLFFFIALVLTQSLLFSQRSLTLVPCMEPFYHGVASGDPLSDRVIIWTRVTPDSSYSGPIVVTWKMATDTGMTQVVNQGSLLTDPSKDYTVKVDVTGLNPASYYYYEFNALGSNSVRGRTKTASSVNADSLRFAVVSCANFEAGFFNTYKVINERNDVDAVLALGDYIYEYETGGYSPNGTAGREWLPANEIVSLSDYRARYSSYHLDTDLMRCHQQYPFILIWDDHESANDSYKNGAENHQSNEGLWSLRKAAAQQAFFEWLPIRESGIPTDPYRIFREIRYGNLLELIMLDTRLHGRDVQAGTSGSTVTDPNRQMLGTDQFSWLSNRLSSSTSQWKILGQQVMMAPLRVFGVAVNGDQWDGYPAERDRVINHIMQNNISDVVVLTGDIHSSWANDVPTSTYNGSNGAGSACVEFVTPSVTSPGLDLGVASSLIQLNNSHMKYIDLSLHGFILLDVNLQRVQADWYYVNTIDQSSSAFTYGTSFKVNHLERFVRTSPAAAVPRAGMTNVVQAPECPRSESVSTAVDEEQKPVILGLYPNPVVEELTLQFFLPVSGKVKFSIFTIDGKQVSAEEIDVNQGVWTWKSNLSHLPSGVYLLQIETPFGNVQRKFVR
ncbi:MAG: alkaline phosphatase D family protein [Flavobacteriales bacterium]